LESEPFNPNGQGESVTVFDPDANVPDGDWDHLNWRVSAKGLLRTPDIQSICWAVIGMAIINTA
jgi:hypothetical protein